jgi:hypothetical protein
MPPHASADIGDPVAAKLAEPVNPKIALASLHSV